MFLLFYVQQYSLLNHSSNTGSENTYFPPSFSMKSRSVSIRLFRVIVWALPSSYLRTTAAELRRYSPSATARSMAVWAAVRFSVSFMNMGMLVSISWRVRTSMISSVTRPGSAAPDKVAQLLQIPRMALHDVAQTFRLLFADSFLSPAEGIDDERYPFLFLNLL